MVDDQADRDIIGSAWSPIGWSVGWIEASLAEVRRHLTRWRENHSGGGVTVLDALAPWPFCLESLLPIEAPWTTELLVSHGDGWTCYLNNDINGGDPASPLGAVSRNLVDWSSCPPTSRAPESGTPPPSSKLLGRASTS